MKSRREIEEKLAEHLEDAADYRHESRWFRRFIHTLWISVVTGASLLTLNFSFSIPYVFVLLNVLAGISLGIAGLIVIGFITIGSSGTDFDKDVQAWGNFSQEKQKIKYLRKSLKNTPLTFFSTDTYPDFYIEGIAQDIQEKRKQADSYQRLFIITQSIVIFLSTSVASVSGGWLDRYFTIPLLVPVLSGLISLITGFSLFLKFREKAATFRQTADALDLEYKAYLLGHGSYKSLKPEEARTHFTEQAEILRKEQLQRQQQLEQSSQQDHTPPSR